MPDCQMNNESTPALDLFGGITRICTDMRCFDTIPRHVIPVQTGISPIMLIGRRFLRVPFRRL